MRTPPLVQIEEHDPRYLRFRTQVTITVVVWGVATVALAAWLGVTGLALALIALGSLFMAVLLRLFHWLQIEQYRHYWQVEALMTLHTLIDLAAPLPPTRLWAASPDLLVQVVSLIRQHRPLLVVELGSGVSTIVSAYAVQSNGSGQIVSLEHDATFAPLSAHNVGEHGLADIASVLHAPLKTVHIGTDTWQWYDTASVDLEALPLIDMLIVDGPPAAAQRLARFPAIPLLYHRLNDDALIVVDDYARADEQEMVARWLDAYRLTIVRTVATERGAVILRKLPSDPA